MALVAIYAAAGFVWAPRLIRSQAEEFVSENYGRKVDIGEIRFNPFTFELNVGRFVLPDADGKPVLSFDSQVDKKLSTLAAGDRNFLGKQPDAEQIAAMLQDPEKRFELLAGQIRLDGGEEAGLPAQAAAYEALKKKERTPELLAAANAEMEAALLAKEPVPETALEELGKARAQSIQEALLGSGAVEASRVFLITEEAKPSNATEGKVRLEMSLK